MTDPPGAGSYDPPRGPALAAAGLVVLVLSVLAVVAEGVASDEEVFHYQRSRYVVQHPEHLLHAGARPLVAVLYFLPAQGGFLAARLAAALASGITAFLVARLLQRSRWGSVWVGAVALLLQPYFLGYGSAVMTEPWTALLVASALWAFARKSPAGLVLALTVLPLFRLELAMLLPAGAVVLLAWRRFLWLLALPLGLVLWNGIGFASSGDPLWLIHDVQATPYPAREPLHYVKSFVWITGLGIFVPVIVGLMVRPRGPAADPDPVETTPELDPAADAAFRRRLLWGSRFLVVFLFFLYTFLATWRPITFGNFRYLAFGCAPLAILAVAGIRSLGEARSVPVFTALGLTVVGSLTLWNHRIIGSFLLEEATWLPLAAALAWLVWLVLPRGLRGLAPALMVSLGLAGIVVEQHAALHLVASPEEAGAAAAVELLDPERDAIPVHTAHPLVPFFVGGDPHDRSRWRSVDRRIKDGAEDGALWFWESHYTPRPGASLDSRSLLSGSGWEYLGGVIASDTTWAGAYFVKTGSPGAAARARAALRTRGMDRDTWARLALQVESGLGNAVRIAEADPRNPLQWQLLADKLTVVGRFSEARGALARAEELAPDDPANHTLRAFLAFRERRLPEAGRAAAEAEKRLPDDPYVRFLYGWILWEQGRRDEGRDRVLDAVDRLPTRWEPQLAAADIHYSEENWPRARFYYIIAAGLKPGLEKAHLRAADCAIRLGNPAKAEEGLRRLIREVPGSAAAYLMLGDLYSAAGRGADARAVWSEGLAAAGDDERLRQRLEGGGS